MANYLKAYMGSVTNGAKDGTEISSEHTMTNPISVILDSAKSETKCVKCAVRCDTGYKTSGATTICFMYWDGTAYKTTGGSIDKFKVAEDNGYTQDNVENNASWQDSISINDEIGDTNKVFWIKVASEEDETPAQYTDVALTIKGIVVEG